MKPLATDGDVNFCKPAGNKLKLRREEEFLSRSRQEMDFHGSLADLPEGLKALGENLVDDDSNCSEEELQSWPKDIGRFIKTCIHAWGGGSRLNFG